MVESLPAISKNEAVTLTFRPLSNAAMREVPAHQRLKLALKEIKRRFGFQVIARGSEMPIGKTGLSTLSTAKKGRQEGARQ